MDKTILGKQIAEILIAPNATPEAKKAVEEIWQKVGMAIIDCVEAYVDEKLNAKGGKQ